MSDGEGNMGDTDLHMLTAEYKDGQLQIVEVTPFDRGDVGEQSSQQEAHTAELNYEQETNEPKFTVLDTSKGLVELDLLNFTLVRNEDGEESYQYIANTEGIESNETSNDDEDTTVTCVLQSSDTEIDQDHQESYVLVDNQNGEGPVVFLQSSLQQANVSKKEEPKKKATTYSEILEKAKALQKAKALVSKTTSGRVGRKRKSDLPSPHELLASPNFKLYLYSCKWCGFKCNAVKEMSAHKAEEHGSGKRPRGGSGRAQVIMLQCARCPFRGNSHIQLIKHLQENHATEDQNKIGNTVQLNTEEVEAADVLVCGACGFETASRQLFKRHIEDVHGAITC